MKKCLNAIFAQKCQHGENLLTFKNTPLLVDLQRKLIKYQNYVSTFSFEKLPLISFNPYQLYSY